MKRPRHIKTSLALAVTAPILLSGCLSGPGALIPPALSLAWQAGSEDEEKTEPKRLSVDAMLAKLRGEKPEENATSETKVPTTIRLEWQSGQASLNLGQKAQVFTALAALPPGRPYRLKITSSPAAALPPMTALKEGLVRARLAAASVNEEKDRFQVDISYDPGLPPDLTVIELVPVKIDRGGPSGV